MYVILGLDADIIIFWMLDFFNPVKKIKLDSSVQLRFLGTIWQICVLILSFVRIISSCYQGETLIAFSQNPGFHSG